MHDHSKTFLLKEQEEPTTVCVSITSSGHGRNHRSSTDICSCQDGYAQLLIASFALAQLPEDKRQAILEKALQAMYHWIPRFSVIIIGPGLGRDDMVHDTVKQACPNHNCKMMTL